LDHNANGKKLTTNPEHNIEVFQSIEELNKAAAEYIITVSNEAIIERGKFTIVLSGGDTPQRLYALLSEKPYREQINWNRTFIFWGDERCVPLNDKRNNAYQAKLILLDKIDIPLLNIHSIPVDLPPVVAASNYEKDLKVFFENDPVHFDIILLGLGENGHTASLFPGTKVIHEHAEGIRAVFVQEEKMFRITMTAPLINKARHILFLVTGEKKADILGKILNSSAPLHDKYPAQLIKSVHGDLLWFADQEAASLIKQF